MDTKEKHWMVSTEQHGTRLDVFLAQCDPMLSRNEARRQIDAGSIWINGRRSRKMSRYMKKGERVTLRPEPSAASKQPTASQLSAASKQPTASQLSAASKQPTASQLSAASKQIAASAPPKQPAPIDPSEDSEIAHRFLEQADTHSSAFPLVAPSTSRSKTPYDASVFGEAPAFLYVDRHMAILNKPSGTPVEPTPNEDLHTCLRQVEAWQRARGVHPKKQYATAAHRLDAGASGAVAFALSKTAARVLSAQFAQHTARRIYWAVVVGCPDPESGTLRDHMDHTGPGLKRSVVPPNQGKLAVTDYRVLERLGPASLIEIRLQTGRTHQIRVHFAHIGHPLVGDWMYCPPEKALLCPPSKRLLLHARELTLTHPNGTDIAVVAPLDDDFTAYLDALRARM
ncbi:pseudouridine synthase [Myxococcota bacterium]|nr:pseudouridine synthase [Myxococcota bacterium]